MKKMRKLKAILATIFLSKCFWLNFLSKSQTVTQSSYFEIVQIFFTKINIILSAYSEIVIFHKLNWKTEKFDMSLKQLRS